MVTTALLALVADYAFRGAELKLGIVDRVRLCEHYCWNTTFVEKEKTEV